MEAFKTLTTKEKALKLNLNAEIYGTIAEIGGGQEVASHFFKAGAASGTIAKTMSAYDMTFSDAIYGKSKKYVCEDKLDKMLSREYNLLAERLTERAPHSNFFAFANTVETLNFGKTNDGHGWIGLRFQKQPLAPPNNCIIHVQLLDKDAQWQQLLLGMLGVNLIHACFSYDNPEKIILALADNLDQDRFQIDMFSIMGPDFEQIDNRLMSLLLVKNGLSQSAMFGPKGNVLQASEALYKKNVLVLRGRFRPVTNVNVDMMINGLKVIKEESEMETTHLLALTELTLHDLTLAGEIDEADYLDRVDLLCALGQTVLISNYREHYKLASYLSNITQRMKLRIICGLGNLEGIFDESYYENLKGGIIESFGQLFALNVKIYVYPALIAGKVKSIEDFVPAPHLIDLYKYLISNKRIVGIKGAKTQWLSIVSDEVLTLLKAGDPKWEQMVPRRVCQIIKEKKMFNVHR